MKWCTNCGNHTCPSARGFYWRCETALARGAFLSLGMVGVAVAGGMVAVWCYLNNDKSHLSASWCPQPGEEMSDALAAAALEALVGVQP